MNTNAFILILAVFFSGLSNAYAESVSIPLKTIKKPANDLLNQNGQPIDAAQAASLAYQGLDLSQLNPIENKIWQNQKYSATDAVNEAPQGVKYLSDEAQLKFTSMSRVQSLSDAKKYYRMTLSRLSHSTLLRAALLRKLGFYVPSPQYYPQLKIQFSSEAEKNTFVENAKVSTIADFESRKWLVSDDKKNHSIVMADVLLEPATSEYFDVQWGVAPSPKNPGQLAAVQRYSRYRAFRSLIIPYSIADIPESLNRYSAKWASLLSGFIVINHDFADSFESCTYEDAKWILRRLGQLTNQDIYDIVKAGRFPTELEALVYAKLSHRISNALEFFALPKPSWPEANLSMNSASGLVKDGKVTRPFVQGYPQTFSNGDREAPFQDGDYTRYLDIRGKSAAIGTVLNNLNHVLDVLSVEDLYAKRRVDLQNRIVDHIRSNPGEPLYQKVEAWGGPVGGFNVGATRHVTTGTYYGSSAPIQLVDNLSVSARLGYFMTLAGYSQSLPTFGANTSVQRDYTHVRPVLSIKEGKDVTWKNLLIPRFMNKLAKVLESSEMIPGKSKDQPARNPMDAFLSDLREGEVFTITDSIALSTYAQLNSSFDVLLGLTPLNFLNTVSLGADASRVILRQTSFMRTSEGVQVFVRQQKGSIFGLNLDINYFINLIRTRVSTTSADLKTDVFVIDYNPEYSQYLDQENADQDFVKKFVQTRKNLQPALKALFQDNATELLYAKFKFNKFSIDHHLKTTEMRQKMLALRINSFTEDHLLKLRYPKSEDDPSLDPKDEEVILFANKKGELEGRDLLSFFTDWLGGLFNRYTPKARIDLSMSDDPNPANTPFGKAYWRTVNTEGDLSTKVKQQPTVSILQHVWGGWKMKKADFFKLIDEIQSQFQNTKLASYRLIEKEAFANVTSVDFYRVTAQMSVMPSGVEKLRDLILQPAAAGKKVPRSPWMLGRLFQNISGEGRAQDKEMYKELLLILGNGNASEGARKYDRICREERAKPNRQYEYAGEWLNGSYYDCLVPWMKKLIQLSNDFPSKDKKEQIRWASEVLFVLDKNIPLPLIMNYLGEKNYIFLVRINGFRTGD
ncbi:MAG: hypothetical protein ACOYOK_04770 [Pseudobdellovibrionaceae bacterium]